MVTPERMAEAATVIDAVRAWATARDDVRGVILVGSWARDTARMDSDVDIVVLTDSRALTDPAVWLGLLGGALVRQQEWGPLREIRLRRASGLEVEMGVVPPSWAHPTPVDPGTFRVIHDGHRIIHDPDGLVATLSDACR